MGMNTPNVMQQQIAHIKPNPIYEDSYGRLAGSYKTVSQLRRSN